MLDVATEDGLILRDGGSVPFLNTAHIRYIEVLRRYRRIHISTQGVLVHSCTTLLSDTTLGLLAGAADAIPVARSRLGALKRALGLVT